jgi:hypothetical protein
LFYLCSYNQAEITSQKPIQKRGSEPQKSRFRVKTVKTQIGKQIAEFVESALPKTQIIVILNLFQDNARPLPVILKQVQDDAKGVMPINGTAL